MNNISTKFAGSHHFLSLHDATPKNLQISQIENSLALEEEAQDLNQWLSLIDGDAHISKEGDTLVLRAGAEGRDIVVKAKTFEENGQVGQEVVVSGDPKLVAQADDAYKTAFTFKAIALNEGVTSRKPGEEAKYTYTP